MEARKPPPKDSGNEQLASVPNCFVVMPFGSDATERRWYKGWYEVVIKPAVVTAGYNPILAATEEQPGAINDEIRSHLAFDPMVLVDLGGVEPDDEPNPNVMYELGIRHALGLPLVIMAWEGQRLPFDVSNQRVIMEQRDFLSQETNRKKVVSFINAAKEGRYYKPMEAVGRVAMIEVASANLGEDSILAALVQEVKDLRGTVASAAFPRKLRVASAVRTTVKKIMRRTSFRKELYPYYLTFGGTTGGWTKILRTEASEQFIQEVEKWTVEDWKDYLEKKAKEDPREAKESFSSHMIPNASEGTIATTEQRELTEELVEMVRLELPPQPWPTGTPQMIRDKLKISASLMKEAIDVLIERGVFKKQVDGVLIDSDSSPGSE